MSKKCIIMMFLAGFLMALPKISLAESKVGIIAVKGKYPNAESMKKIVEGLGYQAELVMEEKLAKPDGLATYDCLILTYRHSTLFEREYKAMAEYVKEGGTLLLTDTAAYWMIIDEKDRKGKHKGIRGGGPLEKVTGAKIIGYGGRVKKFKVLKKTPLTEGLPDEFGLETTPPYDINNEKSRWRTECTILKTAEATSLIKVEAYHGVRNPETEKVVYDMENPKTTDFLTLNSYGNGKCIWLACRVTYLILDRNEKHVLRMLKNVLENISRNDTKNEP